MKDVKDKPSSDPPSNPESQICETGQTDGMCLKSTPGRPSLGRPLLLERFSKPSRPYHRSYPAATDPSNTQQCPQIRRTNQNGFYGLSVQLKGHHHSRHLSVKKEGRETRKEEPLCLVHSLGSARMNTGLGWAMRRPADEQT